MRNAHSLIYHLTIDSLFKQYFFMITSRYLINTIPYMTVSALLYRFTSIIHASIDLNIIKYYSSLFFFLHFVCFDSIPTLFICIFVSTNADDILSLSLSVLLCFFHFFFLFKKILFVW